MSCRALLVHHLKVWRFAWQLQQRIERPAAGLGPTLAPGPPDDALLRYSVDDPPERWFLGTGLDLKYVAQLRLAHARTDPGAIPGVAEPI